MRIRRNTAVELALAVALVLVVVLGAYSWLVISTMTGEVISLAQRDASRIASFVQGNLRLAMLRDHRDDVRKSIEEIVKDPSVEAVSILDHTGRVWVTSDPGSAGIVHDKQDRSCGFCHGTSPPRTDILESTAFEGHQLVSQQAIRADASCLARGCHEGRREGDVLGVLSFSQSVDQTFLTLKRSKRALGLFTVLAVLLASLLVGTVIAGRLHTPMKRLVEGTAKVAAGDMGHRLPIDRSDEFGHLAHKFNEMSRKLSQSRRSLIQSERLISMGKLAAGVAHELNNPLTGVLAFTESLIDDADDGDVRVEDYRVIQREALRCRRIVRDLLDFVRQEKPAMRAEDADHLVGLTLRLIEKLASFRDVTLIHEGGSDLPLVRADAGQVQQVMLNLLINAADAMDGVGTIRIGLRSLERGRWVEISVADDGPGIPEELRDKIFEPFFSTKAHRSNGLGLSICQGIIEQHGGRLEFETRDGEGTTFRVLLPAARAGVPDGSVGRPSLRPEART